MNWKSTMYGDGEQRYQNIYGLERLPVILSPRFSISELVFVYENPTPTGDSTNNKLASEMYIKEGVLDLYPFPSKWFMWFKTEIHIFSSFEL